MQQLTHGVCLGSTGFSTRTAAEVHALVEVFLSHGGQLIELAPGPAEARLAEAIKGHRGNVKLAVRRGPGAPLEPTLRRLNVDAVDLVLASGWDPVQDLDEVVRALTAAVQAGRTLGIGVADWPAWAAARLDTRLRDRAALQLSALTLEYGLAARDVERDLLPMCRALGTTPLAWGCLSGDWLLAAARPRLDETDDYYARTRKAAAQRVAPLVATLAQERGVPAEALALRWVMERGVVPMVTATTSEELSRRLRCLELQLDAEATRALEEASRIDLGFPHEYLLTQRA
jgi:aryl-alcohol dehydrogenase-like predicted oxidoreductase